MHSIKIKKGRSNTQNDTRSSGFVVQLSSGSKHLDVSKSSLNNKNTDSETAKVNSPDTSKTTKMEKFSNKFTNSSLRKKLHNVFGKMKTNTRNCFICADATSKKSLGKWGLKDKRKKTSILHETKYDLLRRANTRHEKSNEVLNLKNTQGREKIITGRMKYSKSGVNDLMKGSPSSGNYLEKDSIKSGSNPLSSINKKVIADREAIPRNFVLKRKIKLQFGIYHHLKRDSQKHLVERHQSNDRKGDFNFKRWLRGRKENLPVSKIRDKQQKTSVVPKHGKIWSSGKSKTNNYVASRKRKLTRKNSFQPLRNFSKNNFKRIKENETNNISLYIPSQKEIWPQTYHNGLKKLYGVEKKVVKNISDKEKTLNENLYTTSTAKHGNEYATQSVTKLRKSHHNRVAKHQKQNALRQAVTRIIPLIKTNVNKLRINELNPKTIDRAGTTKRNNPCIKSGTNFKTYNIKFNNCLSSSKTEAKHRQLKRKDHKVRPDIGRTSLSPIYRNSSEENWLSKIVFQASGNLSLNPVEAKAKQVKNHIHIKKLFFKKGNVDIGSLRPSTTIFHAITKLNSHKPREKLIKNLTSTKKSKEGNTVAKKSNKAKGKAVSKQNYVKQSLDRKSLSSTMRSVSQKPVSKHKIPNAAYDNISRSITDNKNDFVPMRKNSHSKNYAFHFYKMGNNGLTKWSYTKYQTLSSPLRSENSTIAETSSGARRIQLTPKNYSRHKNISHFKDSNSKKNDALFTMPSDAFNGRFRDDKNLTAKHKIKDKNKSGIAKTGNNSNNIIPLSKSNSLKNTSNSIEINKNGDDIYKVIQRNTSMRNITNIKMIQVELNSEVRSSSALRNEQKLSSEHSFNKYEKHFRKDGATTRTSKKHVFKFRKLKKPTSRTKNHKYMKSRTQDMSKHIIQLMTTGTSYHHGHLHFSAKPNLDEKFITPGKTNSHQKNIKYNGTSRNQLIPKHTAKLLTSTKSYLHDHLLHNKYYATDLDEYFLIQNGYLAVYRDLPQLLESCLGILNTWLSCPGTNMTQTSLGTEEQDFQLYLPRGELTFDEMADVDPNLSPIALIAWAVKWILLGIL